ncbi:MAG: hypothetical protein LBK26_00935 [Rickettsiales bacterium]|nr:hypothetical protein [Rickettsiales bacterium]
MSRQIQIRRGTAAEHASFIGAIGEITMDTDAKTIRVHDGETIGGTPLVRASDIQENNDGASLPAGLMYIAETNVSAGNPMPNPWYIKYSNGLCEQGGMIAKNVTISGTNHTGATVVFPITMSGSDYQVQATASSNSTDNNVLAGVRETSTTKTSSSVYIDAKNTNASNNTNVLNIYWKVIGMAAA